jgi:hypothetical protein
MVLAWCAAGCFAPRYTDGQTRCAPAGQCPSGFRCAPDGTCWTIGREPPGDFALADLASADLADDAQPAPEGGVDQGRGPPVARFDVTPSLTTVDENTGFLVQLAARDANGALVGGYAGTPALSTDWGGLRASGPPAFFGGVAVVTVQLTRETFAAKAHVQVTDGAVTGLSADITVTVPTWTVLDSSPVFSEGGAGTWDVAAVTPSWVYGAGLYDLFFLGENGSGTPAGWGRRSPCRDRPSRIRRGR